MNVEKNNQLFYRNFCLVLKDALLKKLKKKWQNVLLFYFNIHEKQFITNSHFLLKKALMLSQKIILTVKHFKIRMHFSLFHFFFIVFSTGTAIFFLAK